MEKVKFVEMKDGDKEDYDLLAKFEDKYIEGTADLCAFYNFFL